MDKESALALPLPDKKIPISIMIIGTFEIAVALLMVIIVSLFWQADNGNLIFFLGLPLIYGTMGAGLWAIAEWARRFNVIFHIIAVPYILYTSLLLGIPSGRIAAIQLLISITIVFALTRPIIQHKFKTVVPKKRGH